MPIQTTTMNMGFWSVLSEATVNFWNYKYLKNLFMLFLDQQLVPAFVSMTEIDQPL